MTTVLMSLIGLVAGFATGYVGAGSWRRYWIARGAVVALVLTPAITGVFEQLTGLAYSTLGVIAGLMIANVALGLRNLPTHAISPPPRTR
jgi:hypothetical protein